MTDLQLYTLVLPGGPQDGLMARLQQQLSTSAILDQDGGIVESLSSEPGDQTISGHYRGRAAGKMATELEELAQSSGVDEVPMAGMGDPTSKDGYYSLESADVEQVAPQTPLVQRFDLTLRYKGTQDDYFRALESNKRKAEHEYGNDTSLEIGAPAAASKVRWYDGESFEIATPTETRSAELGDVDIYDAAGSGLDPEIPTLIYEIGYTEEEKADCRVYDTRGHESKHDGDGNLQWGKVFSTQHGFDHALVLDNGLIRLYLDEDAGTLEAEEWDSTAEEWTSTDLTQPAAIDVYDIDITEIGMIRDKVQITFNADGSLFVLDAILQTGAENILWDNPDPTGQGPLDPDLEGFLEPVASERYVDPNSSKTLVRRQNVRLNAQ